MPDLDHYRGREQGYIKHALTEKYLVPFTIKIGSKWDEIIFLDAFAGPWGAKSENLSDTSFVHRFADYDHCKDSYEEFFGRPGVRNIIGSAAPDDRQDAVVREYCRSLRELCGFEYVSSCVVLQPDKKGIKYFMVFATNSPVGIKVFKEAEAHAAALQDEIKHAKEFGDQMPLFSSDAIEPVSESLRRKYREIAFGRVEGIFKDKTEATYTEVFCKAMAMPLVTERELTEFLVAHSELKLHLDGERRKKPSIERNDRVIKRSRE